MTWPHRTGGQPRSGAQQAPRRLQARASVAQGRATERLLKGEL